MANPGMLDPEDKVHGEFRAVIGLHLANRKRDALADLLEDGEAAPLILLPRQPERPPRLLEERDGRGREPGRPLRGIARHQAGHALRPVAIAPLADRLPVQAALLTGAQEAVRLDRRHHAQPPPDGPSIRPLHIGKLHAGFSLLRIGVCCHPPRRGPILRPTFQIELRHNLYCAEWLHARGPDAPLGPRGGAWLTLKGGAKCGGTSWQRWWLSRCGRT